jgi:hypothetical protein
MLLVKFIYLRLYCGAVGTKLASSCFQSVTVCSAVCGRGSEGEGRGHRGQILGYMLWCELRLVSYFVGYVDICKIFSRVSSIFLLFAVFKYFHSSHNYMYSKHKQEIYKWSVMDTK